MIEGKMLYNTLCVLHRCRLEIGFVIFACMLFIGSGCNGENRHMAKLQNEARWLARYWWTSNPPQDIPDLPKLAKEIRSDQGIIISLDEWRSVKHRIDRTPEDREIVIYSTFCNNGKHVVIRADSSVDLVRCSEISNLTSK